MKPQYRRGLTLSSLGSMSIQKGHKANRGSNLKKGQKLRHYFYLFKVHKKFLELIPETSNNGKVFLKIRENLPGKGRLLFQGKMQQCN